MGLQMEICDDSKTIGSSSHGIINFRILSVVCVDVASICKHNVQSDYTIESHCPGKSANFNTEIELNIHPIVEQGIHILHA